MALPAGVLGAWAILLILDHRRHRNSIVGMGFGNMDSATGTLIVEDLKSRGIDANYFEEIEEDAKENYVFRGISCRNADAETARRVIEEHLR